MNYYGLNKEETEDLEKTLEEIELHFKKYPNVVTLATIIRDLKETLSYEMENAAIEAKDEFRAEGNLFRAEITTGVISESFINSKNEFSTKIEKQTNLFYTLLILISSITILINGVIKIPCLCGFEKICTMLSFSPPSTIEDVFIKISIILPGIWAILFLSKRINEDKKLEQAYLHKQTVAQSFVTYLNFIKENNLQDKDLETLKTLNRVMIESLGLNPALLLDKSTSEKIPMEELLSRILDKTSLDKKS
ncbi:hypothetical protein [Avibacterium avium]|uniref:hypothetical protein n=1 Tax=Avibacterium avium TaxID=751 RepID=UPI003BF8A7DC